MTRRHFTIEWEVDKNYLFAHFTLNTVYASFIDDTSHLGNMSQGIKMVAILLDMLSGADWRFGIRGKCQMGWSIFSTVDLSIFVFFGCANNG